MECMDDYVGSVGQNVLDEFFDLVAAAVQEGLARIEPLAQSQSYIGTYYNWPSVTYKDGAMPSIYETFASGPVDYTRAFRGSFGISNGPQIPTDNLQSFKDLIAFVKSNSDIISRLLPRRMIEGLDTNQQTPERYIDFLTFSITSIPEVLLCRYIHTYNTF
ncbi:hypothetical protein [Geomonas ferrireducens]|uniref:hypothetical protein n=1 Tax=Geomonas ferrireducens TaxID=2570227 RepID=UPI0010A7A411|nr:hypothetical protein [Geomonas ferrireducens]